MKIKDEEYDELICLYLNKITYKPYEMFMKYCDFKDDKDFEKKIIEFSTGGLL